MKSKRYVAIVFAIGAVVPLGVLLGSIIEKRFTNEQVKTMNEKSTKKLTKEEERIIVHKGTEAPFSGKFNNHFEKGTYTCKRCGRELFGSSSKFKSDCGWPSYDDEIKGAIKWQSDSDGKRTEIICDNCEAHLGHVFLNEGYTSKNQRYCVNSLSMDFVRANSQEISRAIFAGGCFWGVEYYFQNAAGVIETTVGYTGGYLDNPTYEDVCAHKTGHAEAIEVVYDPKKTNYEELAKLFFETHDFTQLDRQGPDVGSQYRSGIYYLDEKQKEIANRLIENLKQKGYDVKTEIKSAGKVWSAESYHQDYYEKNGQKPYCHVYKKIFE